MSRRILKLLSVNGSTLFWFEVLFKLGTGILLLPVSKLYFRFAMQMTGFRYLTYENIFHFLSKPLTICAFLVFLVLAGLYALFDISSVVYILDQSAQEAHVSVLQVFRYSFGTLRRSFYWKNVPVILYVLFLIPILNVGAASGMIATVAVPVFLQELLTRNLAAFIAGSSVYLVIAFLSFRWMYSLPIYIITRLPFPAAVSQSRKLSYSHQWESIGYLSMSQILLFLMHLITTAVGFGLIIFVFHLISHANRALVLAIIWAFLGITIICFAALSMPVSFATVTILLESREHALDSEEFHSEPMHFHANRKDKSFMRILAVTLLILFTAGIAIYSYSAQRGRMNLDVEDLRVTEVSAHRGASADCPENTMAAFQEAWIQQTDWIELDVHQSSDMVLYVMHDSSFRRTAGVSKKCWELTWDQIQTLDVGRYFSPEFIGERVPRLEDVIEFAKWRGIRLNIELKPTGHETDMEKQTVDLIVDYGFEDSCVVTSQSYRSIELVKEYNPDIKTVYVMPVAMGDFRQLQAADVFSIQSSYISERLIDQIHREGKQVYAWTVNSRERIQRMIQYGVDNIITNEVALAKECVTTNRTSGLIQRILDYVMW